MAQEYYTILTNAGLAYEAQCKAQQVPIKLTQFAVGDGNGATYNPSPSDTALRRETHRQAINALLQDESNPSWLVAEVLLPDDVGGWTIREIGIYTDTGVLYAIGKYPDSVKPILAQGSGKQFYVRAIFQTSNATSVTLLVDNTVVMASRAYVHDFVQSELARRDGKPSVRVATTGPIALTGLQTIDGIALVAGDRVLVKNQAAGAANGIYVAAAGAWARATDADSGAKLTAGALVPVEAGTVNADTIWIVKTDGAITIGTTSIDFQWAGGLNAPTQAPGDNSPKVANTSFVQTAIAALVASSPAALDTLNELAAALGNDANFAATVTSALALKAPLASPVFTDQPTAPTQARFDSSTKLATTEFSMRALGNLPGVTQLTAGATLTAGHIGRGIVCGGADPYSVVLPSANSCPAGSGLLIVSQSATVTITRGGTNAIAVGSQNSLNSFVLGAGDWCYIANFNGTDTWMVMSGTPLLQANLTSGVFGSSLAPIGHQMLPSGHIMQWGTWLGPASAGAATPVLFSTSFKSEIYSLTFGANNGNASGAYGWYDTASLSGFNGRASLANLRCYYIAFGK